MGFKQMFVATNSRREGTILMKARLFIILLVGFLIVIIFVTGFSQGTRTLERGYLAFINDYNEWTATVHPGFFYSVWIRADDIWVDFDLYVYDQARNLVCSSVGHGSIEICVFYAWDSVYHIKVVSVGGCPPPSIKERPCGEGWYTLGI